MSMVMVEYIYGISNIRDNCYELDMRIPYKGSHKNIDLVYYCFVVWMNCQHHELESVDQIYMLFTLFTHIQLDVELMLFTLFTHIQLHVELNIPGDSY